MSLKAVGGQKTFRLEGIPEMKKTLQAIRKTLDAKGNVALADRVRGACLVPAQMIADEARDLAPEGRTGRLKSACLAKMGKGAGAFAYVDRKIAPHAWFVEKGTSKMPAQPYFRPAVAAMRPMVARLIAEKLPAILADAAAREAHHPPL